jgi:hypothetical protein
MRIDVRRSPSYAPWRFARGALWNQSEASRIDAVIKRLWSLSKKQARLLLLLLLIWPLLSLSMLNSQPLIAGGSPREHVDSLANSPRHLKLGSSLRRGVRLRFSASTRALADQE